MTFVDAIKVCFNKYADFTGVAGRAEYWYFYLFSVLVTIVGSVIEGVSAAGNGANAGIGSISSLISIALVLPRLTVSVRRFRDAGFSPWLMLLGVIPLVAFVVWIIAVGVSAFANSAGLGADTPGLSDLQLTDLVAPFTTPSALAALAVVIITGLLVGIFLFVITLLPSKSIEQGNRILAKQLAKREQTA